MRSVRAATATCAVALVVSFGLLAGCSTSMRDTADSSNTGTWTTSPTGPAGLGASCTADQVEIKVVQGLGSGRDEFHLAVVAQARNPTGCTVQGAPLVTLAGSPAKPVGPKADIVRSAAAAAPTITLGTGLAARAEVVVSELDHAEAARCGAEPVTGVLVQLAGSGPQVWAPFPEPVVSRVPAVACTQGRSGVTVRPFLPTR